MFTGYLIFKDRPDNCFNDDLLNTSLMFLLIFTGMICFFRQALNILILFLGFPFIVYLFLSNPSEFYSNIGIDPEIVNNLPTFPASAEHATRPCIICCDEILEGQELLSLRCPGK